MATNPQPAANRDNLIEADPDVRISGNSPNPKAWLMLIKLYDASDSSLGDEV